MASIPEGIPPEIRHTPHSNQLNVRDSGCDAQVEDDSRRSSTRAAADGGAAPRVGDCLFSQSTVQEQMRHCELA